MNEEPTHKTLFKVAALFSHRSGWWQVRKAYAEATTHEKAREMAERVFPCARHILIRKRYT